MISFNSIMSKGTAECPGKAWGMKLSLPAFGLMKKTGDGR
jgi:hypothetical protein